MKKLIILVGLIGSMFSPMFAFTWAEYEVRCYFNGKEPSFEEYEYLCMEGATDYADYSEEEIVRFIEDETESEE